MAAALVWFACCFLVWVTCPRCVGVMAESTATSSSIDSTSPPDTSSTIPNIVATPTTDGGSNRLKIETATDDSRPGMSVIPASLTFLPVIVTALDQISQSLLDQTSSTVISTEVIPTKSTPDGTDTTPPDKLFSTEGHNPSSADLFDSTDTLPNINMTESITNSSMAADMGIYTSISDSHSGMSQDSSTAVILKSPSVESYVTMTSENSLVMPNTSASFILSAALTSASTVQTLSVTETDTNSSPVISETTTIATSVPSEIFSDATLDKSADESSVASGLETSTYFIEETETISRTEVPTFSYTSETSVSSSLTASQSAIPTSVSETTIPVVSSVTSSDLTGETSFDSSSVTEVGSTSGTLFESTPVTSFDTSVTPPTPVSSFDTSVTHFESTFVISFESTSVTSFESTSRTSRSVIEETFFTEASFSSLALTSSSIHPDTSRIAYPVSSTAGSTPSVVSTTPDTEVAEPSSNVGSKVAIAVCVILVAALAVAGGVFYYRRCYHAKRWVPAAVTFKKPWSFANSSFNDDENMLIIPSVTND